MPNRLALESFEDVLTEHIGPSDDYNAGYAEGLAAGEAAAKADAATLGETLAQAINDINFTYAEAQGQLLASLSPLFDVITQQVLPHCVKAGFAGQLATALTQAASATLDQPVTLCVHPDQVDAIKQATQDSQIELTIKTDPSLTLHAARIRQDPNETTLDVDSLLTQITQTLAALDDVTDRINAHG